MTSRENRELIRADSPVCWPAVLVKNSVVMPGWGWSFINLILQSTASGLFLIFINGAFYWPYSGIGIHSMNTRNPNKRFLGWLEHKMALKLSYLSERLQILRLPKFTQKEKSNSYSSYSYSEKRSMECNLKNILKKKSHFPYICPESTSKGGYTLRQVLGDI